METHTVHNIRGQEIQDPPIARFLFNDTRVAPLWLIVRILLGIQWLGSGWGKFTNPAWMETGEALKGFWMNAVKIPEAGKPPIAFDWYRSFIQGMLDSGSYVWFAKLVAFGELLIGLALIVGLFVGIAAFFAALMNWNFVMAGSASTNALLGLAAILLVLAWKIAGYYGADYFVLPRLSTPWQPIHSRREAVTPPSTPSTPAQATR